MSNACVINATHNSGQLAGSPSTIEAGGNVVLKAFGSGSGAWSVTMAFAPSTSESPVTLTISNVSPSARTSVVSTGATDWVGWVVSQSGEWEASGIVEGYQPDEALDGDLGDFGAGPAPTKAVKANARATVNGQQVRYGGAGVGWVVQGADESLTLAELLATTGSTGATAKCLDPMFGPMGAMFDWAQSLGKWVPRNARIYGTGTGTVYTASVGDINTDVQAGSLAIPGALVYAGIDIAFRVGVNRSSSGAAGTVLVKVLQPVSAISIIEVSTGQNSDILAQGFARYPSYDNSLRRIGARNTFHGFGSQGGQAISPVNSSYDFVATLNAPATGMIQTLTELYAELSYGG